MKQRPIIFNEYQVRALLDGSMTQTRRIMKVDCMDICEREDGSLWPWREDEENHGDYWYPCPFGAVGDRLWVRESYRMPESLDLYSPQEVGDLALEAGYRAPWAPIQLEADGIRTGKWIGFNTPPMITDPGKLRPSIHMPQWASRITLEITGVRVERLHDASESNLLDDLGSMLEYDDTPAGRAFNHAEHYAIAGVPVGISPEMHGFKAWWDKTHGYDSFDANPWVWVIDFKRLEAD